MTSIAERISLLALVALAAGCTSHVGEAPKTGPVAAADDIDDHDRIGTYGVGPTPRRIAHDLVQRKPRMGPPPPGYWRLRPDPAPGWVDGQPGTQPQDLPTWTFRGPRPITEAFYGFGNTSGRVVSVAPHPTDANIVYIGTASGGVWKTVDGGANWTSLTDALPVLNHGAVALDRLNPNVVYAGTGEYPTYEPGDGLFRSTDAGATWSRIATTAQVGSGTSRVVVDPTNSNLIHVTTNDGYTRSSNGGATWTRITNLNGRCSDVVVDPVNPQNVYVAKHGDGVYKSTNSGAFFARLNIGLPTSGGTVGRIGLAISASNPNVLQAAYVQAGTGALFGQYKTTDGGASWSQLVNTPNYTGEQGWYDLAVGIQPDNENVVFAGGMYPYAPGYYGLVRSTDGGVSWTDVTFGSGMRLHPDIHAVAWGPTGTLWVGCDGGVYRSDNQGGAWTNTNATLAVSQLYNVAVHPTNPGVILGGTQDNGTIQRQGSDVWPMVYGGDGGFCIIDPSDPSRQYLTYVFLETFRRTAGGVTNITGPWSNDPREFIAPLVMDPSNPNVLLGGTNRVWRTQDAATGANWLPISPAFSPNDTLTAIAVAPSDSAVIWAGSSSGDLRVTTNAGAPVGSATWVARTTGLPVGLISDIVVKPTDPQTAFVSFDNSSGARVLRTTNGGVTWTNYATGLSSGLSAKALAIDWRFPTPIVYLGTGAGVYVTENGGTTWVRNGVDLPNVIVGDLAIDTFNNVVVVGTYGRGVFTSPLSPCGSGVAYGASTPGSTVTPTIVTTGCANAGLTLTLPLTGPNSALGIVAFGSAQASVTWNGLTILQSLDVTFGQILGAAGTATFTLPVPQNPALAGTHVYAQAAYLDAGTPSGFCASGGLDITLQ